MAREGAFFIGDVALDEYYRAEHWPAHGTKTLLQPVAELPGGMIANAAVVYAGHGGRTLFGWTMNSSRTTELLLADLESHGVDTAYVTRDPALGDSKCIIVLAQGDHTVLAPETGLERIDLSDDALDSLLGCRHLYTAIGDMRMLRHGEAGAAAVLDQVRAGGVEIVLDLDVADLRPDDAELLRRVDLLFVNQVGMNRLCGGRSEDETIRSLLERGTSTVIVTRGPGGCDVHTTAGRAHIPGIRVEVVDVTGAGDTFGATYLHAVGRTGDVRSAAVFANAAAARAVTRNGGRAGMASDAEILDFIRTNQILTPREADLLEVELATPSASG